MTVPYSAGRGHLSIEQRFAFLTQDLLWLQRTRPADPPREVLRRRGPEAHAYFADVHDRTNLAAWVEGVLNFYNNGGAECVAQTLIGNKYRPATVEEYLTEMEDEIAAFKAGGAPARRAHVAARRRKA